MMGVGDYSCPSNGSLVLGYCFSPGTLNEVAAACNEDAMCAAFVTGKHNGQAGAFLKSQAGPITTSSPCRSVYARVTHTGTPNMMLHGKFHTERCSAAMAHKLS